MLDKQLTLDKYTRQLASDVAACVVELSAILRWFSHGSF